jgi:hypothetical protein
MPLAKVHVLEGQYDDARLTKVSEAIQNALIEVLGIPPDDFFQIHHVLPRDRYLHTPAFLGQKYSDDMILLELTFITGRPRAPQGDPARTAEIAEREAGGGRQDIAR